MVHDWCMYATRFRKGPGSAYRQWLAQQETPLSVAKNTGLIFDPLEEWVGA